MKVLIIGSRVPFPLRDGGAIATYNLLKGLSEIGIVVDYISLNTLKHFVDEKSIQENFSFLNNIQTFKIDTKVKIKDAFLNIFSQSSYNIDRFTDSNFTSMLQTAIDNNSYDIIHYEGLFVSQYISSLKTHVPQILRQHNIESNIWKSLKVQTSKQLKKWYIGFLAKRLEKFERTIIQEFDAVVSITDFDKHISQSELGYTKTIDSIPAGIEINSISNTDINYNHVYHVGSMEWMPNQEAMHWFIKEIWPKIAIQSKEIQFFMGGKQMPEIFNHYKSEQFHVLGEIEDLSKFVSEQSILAVPLLSGSGIRIKTIEAMIAGKAVVSTRFGAEGLNLKDNENCLLADDAQTFADAVVSLIKDTEKRNLIAKRGQNYMSEKFGNKNVSLKWVEFYQKITKQIKQ